MKLLLDDRFAPITSEFGLVHSEYTTVAAHILREQTKIHAKRGVSIQSTAIEANLPGLLGHLLPLTTVEATRTLLVPTTSGWTAVFDNGWQGGDAAGLSMVALGMRCHAIRIVAVTDVRRYGARIFELYGPEPVDIHNCERAISVADDGGRWRFDESGKPLAEEEMSWYATRSIEKKFRPEHLALLLSRLQQYPFEEGFYEQKGRLLQRNGPTAAGSTELSLSEALARQEKTS